MRTLSLIKQMDIVIVIRPAMAAKFINMVSNFEARKYNESLSTLYTYFFSVHT